MSLANRKRQYKMFMARGQVDLANDQVKNHPECIEEVKEEEVNSKKDEVEVKTKGKR